MFFSKIAIVLGYVTLAWAVFHGLWSLDTLNNLDLSGPPDQQVIDVFIKPVIYYFAFAVIIGALGEIGSRLSKLTAAPKPEKPAE